MTQSKRFSTSNLILTGMFTAITCVMSQIIIPLQPIPFTLSLLAVFLTGALLEPKYALLSTLAYILLGTFGLPVFAGFKGGPHALTGMTGGFIMAYPIMAFTTSIFYQLSKKIKSMIYIVLQVLGMVISLFLLYLIGTLWFCYVSGSTITYALTVCVFPFVVFDLIKILIAVSSAAVLKRVIRPYFR